VPNTTAGARPDEIMAGSFRSILDAYCQQGWCGCVAGGYFGKKLVDERAEISDYCWLSQMIRRLFQAGFGTDLKEFVPRRLAMFSDEELDKLKANVGVIRNGAKINATIDNDRTMADPADEHGAADRLFVEWRDLGFIGLLAFLKKRGGQLGSNIGQYVLHFMGKWAYVFPRMGCCP
jgi:hypothetical protein